jgi:hypothetical protein
MSLLDLYRETKERKQTNKHRRTVRLLKLHPQLKQKMTYNNKNEKLKTEIVLPSKASEE